MSNTLAVSVKVEKKKREQLPVPHDRIVQGYKLLELKKFYDVEAREYVTVVKVEYSSTRFVERGKRTRNAAAVYIAWALSDNEEDSDGNSVGVEDVLSEELLLLTHCHPYMASDFHLPSLTIPHNGDYSVPASVPSPPPSKRLKPDTSTLAQGLKKCIILHGGVPELLDGSIDPANGKVVMLSWILSELWKLVENETASTDIIRDEMNRILEWHGYTRDYILKGFMERFPNFKYTHEKFTKALFTSQFLQWVYSSSPDLVPNDEASTSTPLLAVSAGEGEHTMHQQLAAFSLSAETA